MEIDVKKINIGNLTEMCSGFQTDWLTAVINKERIFWHLLYTRTQGMYNLDFDMI
jgi:hypothetical protein